jgi:pSer/pThr/pTyr-binding forkhead associated (FHA) protein/cytochrome c-type biogenesis protein CcmH/NrfG
MKITVKVYEGGSEILSKLFDEGVYRVGRSDFSDIMLTGDQVSRSHFEIRVTESAVYMTNMASAGKVKLNGKPTETAEIVDGDEVAIGRYRIVIFHGTRDQTPAEESAPPENSGLEPAADDSELPPDNAPPVFNLEDNAVPEEPVKSDENPFGEPENQGDAPPVAQLRDFPMGRQQASEQAFRTEGTAALRAETVVEMKPVVAKLIFVEGPRAGEELFLETFEVTFGRSKKADIFLDDEKLSRIHAKITRMGMGYRLIDMSSRNGTYVNGVRVLEHPLSSYDMVEFGSTKIKFLIHDIIADNVQGGALVDNSRISHSANGVEQTRSLQLAPDEEAMMLELQHPAAPPSFGSPGPQELYTRFPTEPPKGLSTRNKILLALVGVALIGYFMIPGPKNETKKVETVTKQETKLPPSLPKEYADLSPDIQRTVEGHYNLATKYADQERYEEALEQLKKVHEVLPYYKDSRERYDQLAKKLKEKQIAEANDRAKKDEKEDLSIYLSDGKDYLKEGDFDRAAEAFNSAIVIDPNNPIAIKGLKAAEYKMRDMDKVPPERDPEKEKAKLVADLFQKAVAAFSTKSYQEAIDTAEKIRAIELKNDTQYLNEAKQIIDRARMLQKDEFEPFLIQAKEKFAEGDYNASRDLCEEMIKRDAAYDEAKQCLGNAKQQLNRLAREAYTRGYILESMNRIEEAKQYWNRAKNYVRAGDEYFDKVNKKLEYYQ